MVSGNDRTPREARSVPALPPKLANPTPIVLASTTLWLLATIAFGIQSALAGDLGIRFWTCLAGFLLGIAGYGVFRWQHWASQRGSRGAWTGSGMNG